MQAIAAEEIGAVIGREKRGDGGIPETEPAGVAAERGQQGAPAIGNETGAADPPPPRHDTRLGMEMAGDLALHPLRLRGVVKRMAGYMAKDEPIDLDRVACRSTDVFRRLRVVVAGDPDPVMAGGELL